MRRSAVVLAVLAASVVGWGFVSPEVIGPAPSGVQSFVVAQMFEVSAGEEGTSFTVRGRSVQPYSHSLKVEIDYVAGAFATQGDTSFVAQYFGQNSSGSSVTAVRTISGFGLWQGDSLTVSVTVGGADGDSATTLASASRVYAVDHGVETWVFAPSWLASSSSDDYPAAGAIDHLLQDSGNGDYWRHGGVDADDTDGGAVTEGWGQYWSSTQWLAKTITGEAMLNDLAPTQTHQRVVSVPFDSIPQGCEIVSAKLHMYNVSGFSEGYAGDGQGYYAALDTFSTDFTAVEACGVHPTYSEIIYVPYNGPCQSDSTTYPGWTGGTLRDRKYFHDYGIVQFDDISSTPDASWISQDITDLVQIHRMMGYARNLLWLFDVSDGAGSNTVWTAGPSGTAANQPFIVVRAKPNAQYANIWGDGVIVPLAFSSDDQYAGSNIAWQEVLEAEANTGVTIFVRGDAYGSIAYAPENKLTTAQLDSLNQAGADVLGHSLYHGGDVNSYDPNCGSYSFISDWTTGVPGDSLYDDLSHTWLSTIIGETVTGMAWPRHIYSLDLWEYARDSGMLWARDGTNEQFGECAAVTTAGVDAGEPTYMRIDGTPVAMYALKLDAEGSPGWYAPWDNGAAADAVPVDSTTIAERIRFCVGRATWQGRRPVMLFTHDIREGNYTAAEGLSPGELEDMIQSTPTGGKWMTYSDIMTRFIAGSVACDPPTGSASETYGHTAADLVWRKVQ